MSFTQPLNPHHPLGTTTISRIALRAMLLAALGLSITAATTYGQILSDGDFDPLDVGSAPDNQAPAGAWRIEGVEEHPSQFSMVPTSEFDLNATGNSLKVEFPRHLPKQTLLTNFFDSEIPEVAGEIVRANFDVFVPDMETVRRGGFGVYVGGDLGSRIAPRGPQITFDSNGHLASQE